MLPSLSSFDNHLKNPCAKPLMVSYYLFDQTQIPLADMSWLLKSDLEFFLQIYVPLFPHMNPLAARETMVAWIAILAYWLMLPLPFAKSF